jgi:DNA-binding Xre family transcriptional regulator
MGYQWLLRERMAERGMWKTTELAPLLAERGIQLSPAQIYRLVTQTPERLSLIVFAALCNILECGPGDLIAPHVVEPSTTKRAVGADLADVVELRRLSRPRRARIDPGSS